MNRTKLVAACVVLTFGFLLVLQLVTFTQIFGFGIADIRLYQRACLALWAGNWPYISFPFEYPPLAVLPMALPRLLGGGEGLQYFGICFGFVSALGAAAAVPSILELAPR